MEGYSRMLLRLGASLVAATALVGAAGCAPRAAGSLGASEGSAAAPSTVAAPSSSSPPAPIPTAPTQYVTVPAAKAGASSVTVQTACDGGTATLHAYPDGAGVGMTTTLRGVAHSAWRFSPAITPERDTEEFPVLTNASTHHGVLAIHASSLDEPDFAKNLPHAWPQATGIDMYAGEDVDCGMRVYLNSQTAQLMVHQLTLSLRRSGTINVLNSPLAAGGAWQVSVAVRSAQGTQRQTHSVAARKQRNFPVAHPYLVRTKFNGLTHLRDFTTLTVSSSKNGSQRTWVTLTRTP